MIIEMYLFSPVVFAVAAILAFWLIRRSHRFRMPHVLLSVCLLLGAAIWPFLWGVWPPDIFTGRAVVLSSARSQDGHEFQVVQYWNYSDFYTTEIEDLAPNGELTIAQIDSDDKKQWSCALQVIEAERKVLVSFPTEGDIWDYRWDIGYIVAPRDARKFPFIQNSRPRSSLTPPSPSASSVSANTTARSDCARGEVIAWFWIGTDEEYGREGDHRYLGGASANGLTL